MRSSSEPYAESFGVCFQMDSFPDTTQFICVAQSLLPNPVTQIFVEHAKNLHTEIYSPSLPNTHILATSNTTHTESLR